MNKLDHFKILDILREFNSTDNKFKNLLIYSNIGLDLSVKEMFFYSMYSDDECELDKFNDILQPQVDRVLDNDMKLLAGITKLNISGCEKITDNGLKYLSGIKYLNISFLRITDIGLRYFRRIPFIILYFCKHITANGIINMQPDTVYVSSNYFSKREISKMRNAGIKVNPPGKPYKKFVDKFRKELT